MRMCRIILGDNVLSISEEEILGIIAKTLSVDVNNMSVSSSSENLDEWDSLGHLGVLVALDKAFDGKLAGVGEMATADSVNKILKVLKDNSFI